MQEEEVNIQLLGEKDTATPINVEDNLQFMENSYKLDSSTTSTNIDIDQGSPSTSDHLRGPTKQSKMSLPVNLSFASPVLR